jgi:hypothetical protein
MEVLRQIQGDAYQEEGEEGGEGRAAASEYQAMFERRRQGLTEEGEEEMDEDEEVGRGAGGTGEGCLCFVVCFIYLSLFIFIHFYLS